MCARLEAHLRRDLRSAVGFLKEKENCYRLTTLYLFNDSDTPAYQDITYEVDAKGCVRRQTSNGKQEYDFGAVSKKPLTFFVETDGTYQIGETKGRVFIPNDFGNTKPGAPIWNEVEPIELPRL